MNEVQRQLLADRLDELGRRIERYITDIAKAQKALDKKQAVLIAMRKEKSELEEGVDW